MSPSAYKATELLRDLLAPSTGKMSVRSFAPQALGSQRFHPESAEANKKILKIPSILSEKQMNTQCPQRPVREQEGDSMQKAFSLWYEANLGGNRESSLTG